MQAITDDLRAILKSHFQAGADGFRARIEVGTGASMLDTFARADQSGWGTADAGASWIPDDPEDSGFIASGMGEIRPMNQEGSGPHFMQRTGESFLVPTTGELNATFTYGFDEHQALLSDWAWPDYFPLRFLQGASEGYGFVRFNYRNGPQIILTMDGGDVDYDLFAVYGDPGGEWKVKVAWTPSGSTAKAWPIGELEPGWQVTSADVPGAQAEVALNGHD